MTTVDPAPRHAAAAADAGEPRPEAMASRPGTSWFLICGIPIDGLASPSDTIAASTTAVMTSVR